MTWLYIEKGNKITLIDNMRTNNNKQRLRDHLVCIFEIALLLSP